MKVSVGLSEIAWTKKVWLRRKRWWFFKTKATAMLKFRNFEFSTARAINRVELHQ